MDIERDELYQRAVAIVKRTGVAKCSAMQRELRIGFNRAWRMLEAMERDGIVSPLDEEHGRTVLSDNHHYRSGDANLIREGAEAACRAKMLLTNTGNRGLVDYYAVLHSRLEALADRIER
jgi:hypothetical protein